jgi:alkanesulfonate monooxygenase SsuD/methylene tetrahydromethanopterin reductase-like flavin-dependent oxidoreductase (luciferase family)
MKVALGLPSTIPGVTRSQVIDAARMADQGGLDSIWVIDRVVFPNLDPLATLAVVAAVIERVRIGTSVLLTPLRNPVLLAKEAASIDVLSAGRLALGLGVGGREDDFIATTTDFHTRGRKLTETVDTLRKVWRGEPPVEGVGPVGPKPIQQPIPIWLDGGTHETIRRAARLGDAYVVGGGGPAVAKQALSAFRNFWKEEGRTGEPLTAALTYFSMAPTRKQAEEQARAYLHDYYAFALQFFDPVQTALLGTPEEVAEQAEAFRPSGVDILIFFPCSPDPSQAEAVAGPIQDLVKRKQAV